MNSAAQYLASPTIKMLVGGGRDTDGDDTASAQPQSFFVHKDLITTRSELLAKALRGYAGSTDDKEDDNGNVTWLEGEEGAVRLPDDEPKVFADYLGLLYQNVMHAVNDPTPEPATATPSDMSTDVDPTHDPNNKAPLEPDVAISDAMTQWLNLSSHLYVLCEKLQDTTSKDIILRAMVDASSKVRPDHYSDLPACTQVSIIYAGTPASDRIRPWLVDCWVLMGSSAWALGGARSLPREFLYDIVVGMYERRDVPEGAKARVADVERYMKKKPDIFGEKGADEQNL